MGDESAKAEPTSAINIKVAAQDGNEVFFKIKRNTPLSKLMDAYCDRQGVDKQSVRFLYDGERVQDTSTPESLDMEDQDVIDALLEQKGGRW
jgi:small ubiquitin-related modifier